MRHEEGLAAFLTPSRRARFHELLKSRRTRRRLQTELANFASQLDPRYAEPHLMRGVKHDEHVDQVYELLIAAGAPPTCFVVSDDHDGDEVRLRPAVEDLMWSGVGFISCIPGRLGLYVGEDGSDVFVLRRGE